MSSKRFGISERYLFVRKISYGREKLYCSVEKWCWWLKIRPVEFRRLEGGRCPPYELAEKTLRRLRREEREFKKHGGRSWVNL